MVNKDFQLWFSILFFHKEYFNVQHLKANHFIGGLSSVGQHLS